MLPHHRRETTNNKQNQTKTLKQSSVRWHTPLNPVLRRQRQVELYEFKANQVYRASSRTNMAAQRNPVFKKQQQQQQKHKKTNKTKPKTKQPTRHKQNLKQVLIMSYKKGPDIRKLSIIGQLHPSTLL